MVAFSIPESAASNLREVARGDGALSSVFPKAWLDDLAHAIAAAADWDFDRPARLLDAALPDQRNETRDELRRALLAVLTLALPERIEGLGLPASVLALYPEAVRRVAEELTAKAAYDFDNYAKDVRFALGLTVPVGGQVADIAYSQAPAAVIARLRRAVANSGRLAAAGAFGDLAGYLGARPWRPYLQIHTEARDLRNFNPDGWDRAYARVADVLKVRPDYDGLVGLSWFYDPQVAAISPRLAYLAERQMANGAIRIRLGSSPLQVELATAKSEARRQMYEAGQYKPRCYALVWPRAALIAWAEVERPLDKASPLPHRAA